MTKGAYTLSPFSYLDFARVLFPSKYFLDNQYLFGLQYSTFTESLSTYFFISHFNLSEATMPSKHDTTAQYIADAKGAEYNGGQGPDIKTPRHTIEIETTDTVAEAAQQLKGFRGPVYVAGADEEATAAALEHYENTTIGVMNPSGEILKSSSRKK